MGLCDAIKKGGFGPDFGRADRVEMRCRTRPLPAYTGALWCSLRVTSAAAAALATSPSRLTSRYTRLMSAQDLELIALIDRAQASGATSATALMEGFVYGNLKIEYPSLERETVVAVVRDYLRER